MDIQFHFILVINFLRLFPIKRLKFINEFIYSLVFNFKGKHFTQNERNKRRNTRFGNETIPFVYGAAEKSSWSCSVPSSRVN